jgi:hypothetical protein
MSPDLVNGLFELVGGGFLFRNCWLTYKAGKVVGVSILTTTFFALWGAWNLVYYPSLDQVWSFRGGCVIMAANVLWIWLMSYYLLKQRREAGDLALTAEGA